MGGQCKVNWEMVCHPKYLGGLGVLNTDKLDRVLIFRWLWLEWRDLEKNGDRTGNPCTKDDMDFFYAATSIKLGDGKGPYFGSPLSFFRHPQGRSGAQCKP
jgi:hypothetical protein